MRIDGINKINQIYKTNSTKTVSRKDSVNGKDSFAISDFGRDLQIAKMALKDAPDIRMERVENIRNQIQTGTYNISSEKLADKLVGEYFDFKS